MSISIEPRTATHGRAHADGRDTTPFSPAGLPAHAVGYRALKLWQRALDVAVDVHHLTHTFPAGEQDGLGSELRRAAAAVPAAIAAGSLAGDRADHQRALQSAVAALARVETLTALAERLELVATREAVDVLTGTGDVTRLLRGLTRFLVAQSEGARVIAAFDAAAGQGQPADGARGRGMAERNASACDTAERGGVPTAERGVPRASEDESDVSGAVPAVAESGAAPVSASPATPVPPSMRRQTAKARAGRVRGDTIRGDTIRGDTR